MDKQYGDAYGDLYRRHWWWRARRRFLLETLERELPAGNRNGRLLDVGCGDGLLFPDLAPFGEPEGIEVEGELIRPDNPWRSRIHVGPFDESYRPSGRFSAILMLDVLEHLPDPRRALTLARELLAPDGRLIVTVPAFLHLWTSHDDLNHHYIRYSRRSLRAVADAAGCSWRSSCYFFQGLYFAKLMVRAWEGVRTARPRVPQLPPVWLNRLCETWCSLEQRCARRLPWGSSLLAVLAKS